MLRSASNLTTTLSVSLLSEGLGSLLGLQKTYIQDISYLAYILLMTVDQMGLCAYSGHNNMLAYI